MTNKRRPKQCRTCRHHIVGGGDIIKDCAHEFISGDDEVIMLGELVANHFCHHWQLQECEAGPKVR